MGSEAEEHARAESQVTCLAIRPFALYTILLLRNGFVVRHHTHHASLMERFEARNSDDDSWIRFRPQGMWTLSSVTFFLRRDKWQENDQNMPELAFRIQLNRDEHKQIILNSIGFLILLRMHAVRYVLVSRFGITSDVACG